MKRGLSVSDAEDRFVFQFERVAERNRVLHGGPWHYRNTMLVLGLYDGRGDPYAVPLNTLETWVAVEGLVHNLRNPKALNMVGSGRIRVWQEIEFEMDGIVAEVDLTYDKVKGFCRLCGLFIHDAMGCDHMIQKEREALKAPSEEFDESFVTILEVNRTCCAESKGG
ncbi:hypothetical protein ACLB2K_035223 [Fragaria x ananassa]